MHDGLIDQGHRAELRGTATNSTTERHRTQGSAALGGQQANGAARKVPSPLWGKVPEGRKEAH